MRSCLQPPPVSVCVRPPRNMSTGVPQSDGDLQAHLEEQLRFLESSCESYDKDFDGEAKRLAATIRVLLHDTSSSKSLLGQLNKKGIEFLDTASENKHGNVYSFSALTAMHSGPSGSKYVPKLETGKTKFTPFEQWWNTIIFVDKDGVTISRRELILSVANKDGGSHIDPVLDEKYGKLSRHGSLNWMVVTPQGSKPMQAPERAAVRQIAHEVLRTLKPGYRKELSDPPGIRVSDVSFVPGDPEPPSRPIPRTVPVIATPKLGRNDPCFCGSGKKFKKCHGA